MTDTVKRLRIILISVLLITAAAAALWWQQSDMAWDALWLLLSEEGVLAVAVILLIFLLKTVLWPIPLKAIYIGAGFLFRPHIAILICYIGLAMQLTVGFCIGRSMGEAAVRPLLEKNRYAAKILRIADDNAVIACFLTRFIPGPPADVTNMFLGTLNVKYIHFLLLSLAGMTPTLIPVVFIGESVLNPLSVEFLIPFVISGIVVGATMLIRKLVANKGDEEGVNQ